MKKTLFRKLLIAMGMTLILCLLVYPLLLPTENYFRLVLQLLPLSIFVGAVMVGPLYYISDKLSKAIAFELKRLRLDSKSTLQQYPELKPLARQVSSLKAQIDTQMNELTGQQEQLKILTDNMQEGLLLVSAAGRVLSYNHAALQLLGQEDTGEDYFSVFDLSDAKPFRRLVRQALDGIRGTATLTVDDTAVQLIANPVVRDNRLTGAVLVLLDVTEREKRDALRREFTSNVSHELKTPLTSIYGIADMMQSGMVKKKDIGGFAMRIRDESARMITLIEDIIRLSRLDDESFTEEVLPLDLYEIACNVKEQLTAAAENKHITVTLEGDTAPMHGVPVIVEEMLFNLCDNAIKYNVENGSVTMKVNCTGQQAIFTVTDTGIGIPQADKERIFERFYRVDKSHSKQIGGTGLGLSIVKHGAAFHNATIELESQLGSGTTITLFFPRSAESTALAEREALFDPLNVEIPGEADAPVIQIRDGQTESDADDIEAAEEYAEDTEAYPEDDAVYSEDTEESSEDDAEYSEDTEESSEDDAEYSEDTEAYPEDDAEYFEDTEESSEDNAVYSEDTEEYPEDDAEFTEDTEEYPEDDAEFTEDTEAYPEDDAAYSEDTEESSEDDAAYSEDTEASSEDDAEYSEDTEAYSEDDAEYFEDAEEYQAEYDEPVQGTLFDPDDEAEPEPEPMPRRKHTASRRLALDETDQLLNEAAAALNLELFTDDEPEEDAPLPEEPEQEPLPAAETPASEPETEPRHPRRIDVVPIDEDTMDIRI
jgi:two-component system phosphate regulon sensor histidine kinase PhoR